MCNDPADAWGSSFALDLSGPPPLATRPYPGILKDMREAHFVRLKKGGRSEKVRRGGKHVSGRFRWPSLSARKCDSSIDQKGHGRRHLAALALGALGVVYGDIGTSPLYAVKECFYGPHAVAPPPENVLGVLSLIFWSLILIVSIKYLWLVLRADNQREGGILSLMALAFPERDIAHHSRRCALLVLLGVFGAALLYGDGMITPAISVLSAGEGLKRATSFFQLFLIPITVAVLALLFSLQSSGTGHVGRIFGPVMLLWFVVIAALGLSGIARRPEVLWALNPGHGFRFIGRDRKSNRL